MTPAYVGGDYRVVASGTLAGLPLGPGDVTSLQLAVYRDGGALVAAETAMDWDAGEGHWEAVWDAPATEADAGDYWARVTVVDLAGNRTPVYLRVRLRPNPAL